MRGDDDILGILTGLEGLIVGCYIKISNFPGVTNSLQHCQFGFQYEGTKLSLHSSGNQTAIKLVAVILFLQSKQWQLY